MEVHAQTAAAARNLMIEVTQYLIENGANETNLERLIENAFWEFIDEASEECLAEETDVLDALIHILPDTKQGLGRLHSDQMGQETQQYIVSPETSEGHTIFHRLTRPARTAHGGPRLVPESWSTARLSRLSSLSSVSHFAVECRGGTGAYVPRLH
jgi:hypothetical protein